MSQKADYITLEEAMAWLNKDHEWRRFQVDYPEARQGDMGIEVYKIPRDDLARARTVRDEGMERDPGFGTFRRLVRYNVGPPERHRRYPWTTVWMSDTRAEIHEHYDFFRKVELASAFGQARRILINGLGLGVVVHGVLTYPGIEHIDVVEYDPSVIALVGPLIQDTRVQIHHASAFDIEWPRGTRWDLAWHDIWPYISGDNLPEMDRLYKKYKGRVKWQGSWQREGCLAYRKVYREMARGTLPVERALEILGGKAPWLP